MSFKTQTKKLIDERRIIKNNLSCSTTRYVGIWRDEGYSKEKIKAMVRLGKYFLNVLDEWAFDDNQHRKEIQVSIIKLKEAIK